MWSNLINHPLYLPYLLPFLVFSPLLQHLMNLIPLVYDISYFQIIPQLFVYWYKSTFEVASVPRGVVFVRENHKEELCGQLREGWVIQIEDLSEVRK